MMEAKIKKIVVVDDDPDILQAIKIILELQGYSVSTSQKGECVFKITRRESPNLILLDVLLSGSDGRNWAKQLKNEKDTKDIPIILISADPSVHQSYKDCGADDFIPKPFDVDVLLKRVKLFIS